MDSYTQGDLFLSKPREAKQLAFDLETQNSFDDVGGRNNLEKLKMSVGITLDLKTEKFTVYKEDEAAELCEELLAAEFVVGFNVRRFDYRVLAPYTKKDLSKVKTIDLLEVLEGKLGHRVKLDDVARATLGTKKSGHGLQAIEWFRKGNWDDLIKYCKDDVRITADVWFFGKRNGHVLIPDWNQTRKVEVQW